MEKLIFLLATSFVLRRSASKKFRNYHIGDSGCSVLLPSGACDFERTKTSSGDNLFFCEFDEKNVSYGIICVELQEQFELEHAVTMLISYTHKLKGPFFILHQVGLQKEIDWNTNTSRAFINYWQDADRKDWKIKAYTDGKFLAFLYVKNIAEADVKRQDQFLDSFQFRRSF